MNVVREPLERLLMAKGAVPALIGLAVLLRTLVLFIDVTPMSDAGWYFSRATSIARGDGYTEVGLPTAYWPPGYPLTLAVLFRTFGPSVVVAQLFNLACAAATGWLTLDIGRRIFRSEAAARLGLLLFAIYPNSIGYTPLLFTETYFTMLLLAGCWTVLVLKGPWRIVAAGAIFGLATLVKAQSLVLVPMLFALVLLQGGLTGSRFLSVSMQATATLLVCAAAVFPWSYRNHALLGEWIAVSTNGGLTLLTGNNPSAQGDYTPDDPLVTSIQRTVGNQVEVDREAKRRAFAWIGDNPGAFVGLIPKKLFRLWAPDGEAEWFYQSGYADYEAHAVLFRTVRFLNQAYYLSLMSAFAFAGILLAWKPERRADTLPGWRWLPFLVALFPTLIAVVFSGQSRFHFPVMPLVVITVGWLVMHRRAQPATMRVERGRPEVAG